MASHPYLLHYPYPTSPVHDLLPSHSPAHDAKFDVQVRVQRSFSFEELQSGSYFASLDESDLQFYRVYGQPVLIPSSDEVDGNFVLHGTYPSPDFPCEPRLHLDPPVLTTKSYTLQNPLGEAHTGSQSTHAATQLSIPAHDWQPIKQEPIEGNTTYPNPALPAIASQLYTLPDHDDDSLASVMSPPESSMRYGDDQKQPMYDEPPMDSLPFPPPTNSASPPFFQTPSPSQAPQDGLVLGSPSFVNDAPFQMNSRDEWEDSSTLSFSQSLSQQYASSSVVRSQRRHSRSPSLRLSPVPHTKRSLDKKPALACLFCRGRKIACGPPQPGSKDKTCNQCARRHLKCEYPLESRRGMRKRRSLIPRIPSTSPDGPRVSLVKASRKRSAEKGS